MIKKLSRWLTDIVEVALFSRFWKLYITLLGLVQLAHIWIWFTTAIARYIKGKFRYYRN